MSVIHLTRELEGRRAFSMLNESHCWAFCLWIFKFIATTFVYVLARFASVSVFLPHFFVSFYFWWRWRWWCFIASLNYCFMGSVFFAIDNKLYPFFIIIVLLFHLCYSEIKESTFDFSHSQSFFLFLPMYVCIIARPLTNVIAKWKTL